MSTAIERAQIFTKHDDAVTASFAWPLTGPHTTIEPAPGGWRVAHAVGSADFEQWLDTDAAFNIALKQYGAALPSLTAFLGREPARFRIVVRGNGKRSRIAYHEAGATLVEAQEACRRKSNDCARTVPTPSVWIEQRGEHDAKYRKVAP